MRGRRPGVYRLLAWPFLLLFAVILALLVSVALAGVSFAYEQVGIGASAALLLLVVSLVGSWINIPLWRLPPSRAVHAEVVSAFGVRWLVPVVEEQTGTIVAVNVGGALVPTGVSAWILANDRLWWRDLIAAAIVCAVVHRLAEPVTGLGIAVPALAPPIAAALVSLALSQGNAAAGAFVAGTLGTLIGADLLNLHRLRGLGAPIASIGGAGTFDGIFLSGVLAVILAASL